MTATATPVPAPATSIEALAVEHVSVRFGGLQALNDVTLHANRGEVVGLIGPNGAGKTTLLNVITGLIRPQAGTVSIAGRSLGRTSVHQRARLGLARTFQRVTLFSELSVREHIQLSAETARRRAHGNVGTTGDGDGGQGREVDPDALIHRVGLPVDGDADVLGLPLGHARLVELAMALAAQPEVLLLDEPFSGLGASERDHLRNLLAEVRSESQVATVLVEHDVDIVSQIADRVLVLDFGVAIGSGPPAEVLADPAVRQAYFGMAGQEDA
jgi:branched-chain amino acid transport system ATP-binding protein